MKIGSTPIEDSSKFRIDFSLMKKLNYSTIDIRCLLNSSSEIYNYSEKEFNEYFLSLKKECEQYDLLPYQMHAMWDTNLFSLDKKENWDKLIPIYEKNIKACSILKTKYLVIHPRMPFGWNTRPDQDDFCYQNNLNFLKQLLPYLIKYDVILCLENMPSFFPYTNIDEILKCINEINDSHIAMCFDVGHYNVADNKLDIYNTLLKIGDNLKVVHVHDNDRDIDSHKIPGKGNVNWKAFLKGLNDINFTGPISLEIESNSKNNDKIIEEHKDAIQFLLETEKLINR